MERTRKDDYFYSLVKLAGGEDYTILFRKLYDIEFYSSVEMDKNRAEDGLNCRDEWTWEHGFDCGKTGPCSVLEMLIGLARRYIFVSGQPLSLPKVMQLFLENLDLLSYTDEDFGLTSEKEIYKKVQKFLDRKYSKNGRGSLFPLYKTKGKDLRTEEIWYQMNYYLIENYDL